jgi:hypothetical protein
MFSDRHRVSAGRRPLIVEFIGTPGSGKTTLSKELISVLRERGMTAWSITDAARDHALRTVTGRTVASLAPPPLRAPLLWQVFYALSIAHLPGFLREYPELCRRVVRSQLERPVAAATKRRALYWFFQLAGRHRFLTSTAIENEAIVLDDGFIHRSVQLFASHSEEPNSDAVAKYVGLLPIPDLLVSVVAGLEVCQRRVYGRGVWTHRRHLEPAELSRYLVNAEEVAQLAVRHARTFGWDVADIPNDGRPLEDVRRGLERIVESRFGASWPRRRGAHDGSPGSLTSVEIEGSSSSHFDGASARPRT